MSRLLNSTILQRAAAGTTATAATTTTKALVAAEFNSHVVAQRRWKSLLLQYNLKHQRSGSISNLDLNTRSVGRLAISLSSSSTSTSTTKPTNCSNRNNQFLRSSSQQFKRTATTAALATTTTTKLLLHTKSTPTISFNKSSTFSAKREFSIMPENRQKCLNVENINPNFISMEYAVRGPLVIRAGEIEKELAGGEKKPFNEVIRANIGDCHAMGQQPITFLRQLLALTVDTSLLDSPNYPEDVKKRALDILKSCQGCSVGAYTDSAGLEHVRRQVADFIAKRDGFPSDWHNIFLTAGATPGVKSILSLLCYNADNKKSGIMVPIPQYPLYSATLAEYGMEKIDYYLEEETNWSLNRKELQRALDKSKDRCLPRAIVVINPGNPTGQVLSHDNIIEIIKFAYDNKLVLLADEVYQDNIWDKNSKFYSFKKIINELGAPYKDMELISFMSTSKGYLGECGIRGGYMEVVNMCPKVQAMLNKCLTASLCGTSVGQVAVSALVNPPHPGEPSYEKYITEKNCVLNTLKERAQLVHDTLNSFEGFKVNVVQGAMYVFPQIQLPKKAIEVAESKGMKPDFFYAFELLETTGICIVPGSGFGQKPNTYHFRTTILPPTDKLKIMMNKFKVFHEEFMKKYK